VIAVIAQRLIRVLCNQCKEPFVPDPLALKEMDINPDHLKDKSFFRAKGCQNCFQTGYRDRIGIYEIMVFDEGLKSLILRTYDSNQIKNLAIQNKMISLRQDGIQKVIKGITTVEEVIRVTEI
jgi:general secretion pathway protein E